MTKRTVVITGATGGIGEGLCGRFYREGWHVVASDKARTCDVRAHSYVSLDLAHMCSDSEYRGERMEALCNEIPDGRLNALINNAAVQIVGSFEDLDAVMWRETIDVNLLAPAFLSRNLLTELVSVKGLVLNISSIHSQLTKRGFTAYATSKAGLVGLTQSLAVELGGRVRVNAISLGAVSTSMLSSGFEGNPTGLTSLSEYHPSGCIGSPEEVAEVAFYLADNQSMFLTGTILGLNGAIAFRLHDPG